MRRLQIKFPNQIRISGWDFGSSARAMNQAGGKDSLMTYECEFPQADLRTVRRSTTERKSMSTKTTIKRIALVAVAALGLGVVSSVAPASATGQTASSVSIGAASSFKTGVFNVIPVTVSFPAGYGASDTMTINAQITSAPTQGGNANAASRLGTGSTAGDNAAGAQLHLTTSAIGTINSDLENTGTTLNASVASGHTAVGQLAAGSGLDDADGAVAASSIMITPTSATVSSKTIYLAIKPDLAGSYGILVSTNATGATYYTAGDTSATATFATTGTVASATITALNTAPVGTGSNDGVLLKVVLKDAAGSQTGLGSLDSIKFTASDTTNNTFQHYSSGWTSMSGDTAVAADFINGVGYFRVKNGGSADATNTVTITGSGTLSSSVTASTSVNFLALGDEGLTAANTAVASVSSTSGYSGTAGTSSGTIYRPSTATSTTVKYTFAAAAGAAGALGATIADSGQKILGTGTPAALTWRVAVAYAKAATSASVTVSHAALSTSSLTITADTASDDVIGAAAATYTFTGRVAGTSGTNTFTATPSSLTTATGGTITITAVLKDEFKTAIANGAVSVSVAGRNAKTATSLLTDANGYVTYTYTDAGTAGSSDVVSFTSSVGTTTQKDVTITYSTATVGSVTLTGGNTTAGVTSATKTIKDINAGDGAEGTTHTITATVKDSNGNLLAGIPVTWTISGTGAAVLTSTKTSYSAADGTASTSVYGWLAGTYTVTATAGAKTGTAEITLGQSTNAGEERTVTATVSNNIVSVKVLDRFGNTVPNVTIYASSTGGVTINSKTKDSTATDVNGIADFIVSGSGDVTVSTISYSVVGGTGSGQSNARKGALDYNQDAADDTAFTAYVAGTASKDEVGVGSSYDAAGVPSVTVAVASAASSDSVDAANEATDAANAATDAANAAAEAADAATAAAQDAQAAVAELATKVASLIAGIKAQITTLTNLVIKIQKKVRA